MKTILRLFDGVVFLRRLRRFDGFSSDVDKAFWLTMLFPFKEAKSEFDLRRRETVYLRLFHRLEGGNAAKKERKTILPVLPIPWDLRKDETRFL